MMKILFSLDNYDHGTGGAEMSIQALAHQLAMRGHEVRVIQRNDSMDAYDDGPIRVHTYPLITPRFIRDHDRDTMRWNKLWGPKLDKFLDEYPPDLIITQNRLLYSTVDVATHRDIPVVVFVRAFSMFCPTQFRGHDPLNECNRQCKKCLPWRLRIKYGSIRRNLDKYEKGLRKATLLIANSRYMREVIRHFYDMDAAVVYPTIDFQQYRANASEREGVLFVKPQYVKGLPIFIQVARQMPDTRFFVAGKVGRHARTKLNGLENVECMGWMKDMRVAYAKARVLLGPSIWPEPFGRIFIEAAANGIPSVASKRGGIPEAVGKGGILIDDIFDVNPWVEGLRQLEDPDTYTAYASNACKHAKDFSAEESLLQFTQNVRKVMGIEL
jgi:glycosyltransferase involved in cell wall biosynthesis